MINKISFKNYKVFKNQQIIKIKPITILIGKNNTGKSAILKLPVMIENSLHTNSVEPISNQIDDLIISNEYIDIIYGKFSRALELDLFQTSNNEEQELKINISVDIVKNLPILEYWFYKEIGEFHKVENDTYYLSNMEMEYQCDFRGLRLQSIYNITGRDKDTFYEQPFELYTDYIGGIRCKAEKWYDVSNVNQDKSGIDGRNLYNFLINDFLTTEKKYFNKISDWIREKFEGWLLHVDADSEPYNIELRKDNLKINLTETGLGISQSLPLIIRAFKPCSKETLIIIEEPEAHLHPFAHAELAQVFVDSLGSDINKKYLIETHSLNFLLRLRRMVAEGNLDKDNLVLYYVDFDEEKNESRLMEIIVDNGGGVNWWPEGIFGETSKETRAIYNAQINDFKNVD